MNEKSNVPWSPGDMCRLYKVALLYNFLVKLIIINK